MNYYLHKIIAEIENETYSISEYTISKYDSFEDAMKEFMKHFKIKTNKEEYHSIEEHIKKVLITTKKENLFPRVKKVLTSNKEEYIIKLKENNESFECYREFKNKNKFVIMKTNFDDAVNEYVKFMSQFEDENNKYYVNNTTELKKDTNDKELEELQILRDYIRDEENIELCVCNNKYQVVELLKDRYIEDIFDEFKDYIIENENYNLTFNDYMLDFYESKYKIINGLYIVTYSDELPVDEENLTKIFKKYGIETEDDLLNLIDIFEEKGFLKVV